MTFNKLEDILLLTQERGIIIKLKFWIISIIISLLSNFVTNNIIEAKIENSGKIFKPKKSTKGKRIISLIFDFTPYLNIFMTVFNLIIVLISLKNEKLFNILTDDIKHSPEYVISNYKRNKIDKKTITEMLILDGADKKTIKEEESKIKKYETTGFATKEKGCFGVYLDDSPVFNEKDYKKAYAQELANQFIFELECCENLTQDEKIKYLNRVKKVFLDDLNNKNKVKPITKVLKQKHL